MPSTKLQSEFLRAARGKLSSSAFSGKLGYRFNQYARWEKGERRLLWNDFVAICRIRRLPLREQVKIYLGFEGDFSDTGAFTKNLLAGRSIDQVAKATKLSRSKISRWLHGKAEPTFLDVYTLLSAGVNSLSFLEPLVDLEKIPSLAADYAVFKQQRELAFTHPHLDALMEALLVHRYESLAQHDPKVLAAVSGLTVEEVEQSLAALQKTGMVEKKAGKYRAIEIGTDYRSNRRRMATMLVHWLKKITAVVEKVAAQDSSLAGSHVGFSVISLSEEAHEKALSSLRDFVRAMHVIGSEDRGVKEKVVVFTTALVDAHRFGR